MELTPWGVLPAERHGHAEEASMSGWPKNKSWEKYINDRTEEFAEYLWPKWDPVNRKWEGAAADKMHEATKAELEICVRELHQQDILQAFPNTHAASRLSPKNHLWHYRVEDFIGYDDTGIAHPPQEYGYDTATATRPFSNIVRYDPDQNADDIWEVFCDLNGSKVKGTFQFKLTFQRPRPYTATMILGVDGVKHHTATRHIHTGGHPAFPSGHCLQGLLISGGLIHQQAERLGLGAVNVDAIMQYGVDFGDRRVFAGVHYPTDNIASWVNAVLLSGELFDDNKATQARIKHAIRTHSRVYKVINRHYRDIDVLKPAVAYMDKHI